MTFFNTQNVVFHEYNQCLKKTKVGVQLEIALWLFELVIIKKAPSTFPN